MEQADTLQRDIMELFVVAGQQRGSGAPAALAALYRNWLAENLQHPLGYVVWFNLGTALMSADDNAAAEPVFREALRLNPDFLQSAFNLGTVLEKLHRHEEALATWRCLTALPDESTEETRELLLMGLNNAGRVLEDQKRYAEAEALLERSLRLKPRQPKVLHHWIHLRQKQCSWPVYANLPGQDFKTMLHTTSALAMLNVSDDPELQLSAGRRFAEEHITPGLEPLAPLAGYGHQRLRVGYLSSDFCQHPVAMLIVELLELHDRSRVEVFGYCWSPDDGSDLRRRVLSALDHYVPIGDISDEAAAARIRADEIDILLDLQGPTSGARPNILARRPGVVQVSYLGFPGTGGMSCVDYILCDRFVVPPEALPHMAERPLYLPQVFQVCDTKRAVGPIPTRKDCGLPEDGVVYCSFNNSHKYTPRMFTVWLNILRRVPGSVLWLVADNPSVQPNLVRFCQEQGISEDRLVFAPRALPPDYLARYALADLFLDCFPFNGGTTANDALWMGLPILTLTGRSFASRMAGSLLINLGIEELLTTDLGRYEELAVDLGHNPQRLAGIKQKLATARETCALFQTKQQARHIEEAFLGVMPAGPQRKDAPRAVEPDLSLLYCCLADAPMWTGYPAHVQPLYFGAMQQEAGSAMTLRDLAPQWEPYQDVVGSLVACFALKNALRRLPAPVQRVGLCHPRKFVSRGGLEGVAGASPLVQVVPAQSIPQQRLAELMLPVGGEFLLGSPGQFALNGVGYDYLYQYKDVAFVEDLLRYVAEAVELGVLGKEDVYPLLHEKIFFTEGLRLGVFPTEFWIQAVTALETVTWSCVQRYETRRDGGQTSLWGHCGQRLGSYLLLKQLRSHYGNDNWTRFFGCIHSIDDETAVAVCGAQ